MDAGFPRRRQAPERVVAARGDRERVDVVRVLDGATARVEVAVGRTIHVGLLLDHAAEAQPGDWDVLGCQQYGPLLDIEIP